MHSDHNRRRALAGLAAVTLVGGCATQRSAQAEGREKPARRSDVPPDESQPDLNAIKGMSLRVVPKGGMMTSDYRDDRLTILLDEDERIERAYVG
ncbi:hypothetical protein [Aquibaculum sediminis]|uniref:hypothetical protein n=1 Tax=Aquibaculum sediminis TaxID=3231907 RepID=UPI003452BF0F